MAATAAIVIVVRMITGMWGEPLLSEVGSRGTPLWIAWTLLSVYLAVTLLFLWISVRYLYRVARGRIPRIEK